MCHWFDSGSGHLFIFKNGLLAQAVEHLTFNQVVRGSSPRWLTKENEEVSKDTSFFHARELCIAKKIFRVDNACQTGICLYMVNAVGIF